MTRVGLLLSVKKYISLSLSLSLDLSSSLSHSMFDLHFHHLFAFRLHSFFIFQYLYRCLHGKENFVIPFHRYFLLLGSLHESFSLSAFHPVYIAIHVGRLVPTVCAIVVLVLLKTILLVSFSLSRISMDQTTYYVVECRIVTENNSTLYLRYYSVAIGSDIPMTIP